LTKTIFNSIYSFLGITHYVCKNDLLNHLDSSELAKKQNEYKIHSTTLLAVSIPLFSQNLAESKELLI
jgi:hypothetical protein